MLNEISGERTQSTQPGPLSCGFLLLRRTTYIWLIACYMRGSSSVLLAVVGVVRDIISYLRTTRGHTNILLDLRPRRLVTELVCILLLYEVHILLITVFMCRSTWYVRLLVAYSIPFHHIVPL